MSVLTHDRPVGTTPGVPERPAQSRWLPTVTVVLLLAVVGLSAWIYVDHNNSASTPAGTKVVKEWVAAMNAGDITKVQSLQTTDAVWYGVVDGGIQVGPLKGDAMVSAEKSWIAQSFRLDIKGTPTVAGTTQVVMVGHHTMTGVDETYSSAFNLRSVGGQLKVAEIIILPLSKT